MTDIPDDVMAEARGIAVAWCGMHAEEPCAKDIARALMAREAKGRREESERAERLAAVAGPMQKEFANRAIRNEPIYNTDEETLAYEALAALHPGDLGNGS